MLSGGSTLLLPAPTQCGGRVPGTPSPIPPELVGIGLSIKRPSSDVGSPSFPNKKQHGAVDPTPAHSSVPDEAARDPRERFGPVSSSKDFVLAGPVADVTGFTAEMVDDLQVRNEWIAAGNVLPAILGIADVTDLRPLFDHYFEHLHAHFPILNPTLHTLAFVASRSQTLLTVVCAISAKYLTPNGDLSNQLKALATRLCFKVIGSGHKSVEIVQAALLLTAWPLSSTCKVSEDNTWALTSMAACMARELKLRQSCIAKNEEPTGVSLEEDNKVATWLYCNTRYNGLAIQLGRSIPQPPKVPIPCRLDADGTSDDFKAALHIVAQIFFGVHEQLHIAEETAENRSLLDLSVLAAQFDGDLAQWRLKFKVKAGSTLHQSATVQDQATNFRKARLDFMAHYTSLCIHSNVLKHALEFRPLDSGASFRSCHNAATSLLRLAKQDYSESGWLVYAPDSVFIAIAYASVSLLRFCQPPLKDLHNHKTSIFLLLESMISHLQRTTDDATHPARQNAAFLRNAIDTFPGNNPPPPTASQIPRRSSPNALFPQSSLVPVREESQDIAVNEGGVAADLDFPFFARDWTYSDSFWSGVLGDPDYAPAV